MKRGFFIVACVLLLVVSLAWLVNKIRVSDRLLSWQGDQVEVWLTDPGGFDSDLELHVNRNGRLQSEFVIDKSTYSTLRMIQYRGQILVANDKYIFGSYDFASDRIAGYSEVPFTIWEGQGVELDRHKFSDQAPVMRRFFKERREGEMETPAETPVPGEVQFND